MKVHGAVFSRVIIKGKFKNIMRMLVKSKVSRFIQMSIEGSDVLWDVAFVGNTQQNNNDELKRKKKE